MPEDKLAYYKARDPVDRARAALIDMGGADKAEIEKIEADIAAEFESAVEFSTASAEISIEAFREFSVGY